MIMPCGNSVAQMTKGGGGECVFTCDHGCARLGGGDWASGPFTTKSCAGRRTLREGGGDSSG